MMEKSTVCHGKNHLGQHRPAEESINMRKTYFNPRHGVVNITTQARKKSTLRRYYSHALAISALQIIFVNKKQKNLQKALIPPCGVLEKKNNPQTHGPIANNHLVSKR